MRPAQEVSRARPPFAFPSAGHPRAPGPNSRTLSPVMETVSGSQVCCVSFNPEDMFLGWRRNVGDRQAISESARHGGPGPRSPRSSPGIAGRNHL